VSLAIARGPISRYVKGRLPRRLWVLELPRGSWKSIDSSGRGGPGGATAREGPGGATASAERVSEPGLRQSGIRAGFHLYIAGEGRQGC
jgi:hypothetical protein